MPQSPDSPPDLRPPLEHLWTATIPSDADIKGAPLMLGDQVAARCGDVLAGVRSADGQPQWATALPHSMGDPALLVRADDYLVVASPQESQSQVMVASPVDGSILWSQAVRGTVMPEGLGATPQAVFALAATARRFSAYDFALRSGELRRKVPAPGGADSAAVLGDNLLFGSRAAWVETVGLYLLAPDADSPRRVADVPVGAIRTTEQVVVCAVEQGNDEGYEVAAFSSPQFEKLWSSPSMEFTLDAAGDDVVYVEPDGGPRQRACLADAMTGDRRWRSTGLDEDPLDLFIAGDVVGVHLGKAILLLSRNSGEELQRLESPEWLFSWGAGLADGRLVLGHSNELMCFASTVDRG